MSECSVVEKSWSQLSTDEFYAIAKLRTDVFFLEQQVDETEFDDRDREPATEHLWVADATGTAAYLRVLLDDAPEYRDARRLIGRVVVRPDRRGEGLARLLLDRVIDRHGHEPLLLHSQQYIAPLYAGVGFEAVGGVYLEASIPHQTMYRPASASPALRRDEPARSL